MEEFNAWLDPESGNHKNKKSMKPEIRKEPISEKNVEEKYIEERLIPGNKKTDSEKVLSFLNTLLEDSLQENLPKNVEKWAIENFDKEWTEEFLKDIKTIKKRMLNSSYFPSNETMFLLKYIFLLNRGYE